MPAGEEIRFVDVLTTATAIANYLGASDVTARHLLDALAIVRGEIGMEALGRPVSPLVSRGQRGGTEPRARELVQRWWAELGADLGATLEEAQQERLRRELAAIAG
jgi:hypothetical protein